MHRTSPSSRAATGWMAAVLIGIGLAGLAVGGDRPGVPRALTLIANLASPWALGAFAVGYLSNSKRTAALAGALSLLIGMAVFFVITPPIYLHSIRTVLWAIVALSVGPVMGYCGFVVHSSISASVAMRAAPSALLLAEAIWLVIRDHAWRWKLGLEPHRWNDLIVVVSLMLGSALLPLLTRGTPSLTRMYMIIVGEAIVGALALASLQYVLVRI